MGCHTEILLVDFPIFANDERCGETDQSAETFDHFVISDDNGILQTQLINLGSDILKGTGFDSDAKHLNTFVGPFFVNLVEVWNLRDTRLAPRGPEIDDGHLPLDFVRLELAACDLFQLELGRWALRLADGVP